MTGITRYYHHDITVLQPVIGHARTDMRGCWNRHMAKLVPGMRPCWNRHMEMLEMATSNARTSTLAMHRCNWSCMELHASAPEPRRRHGMLQPCYDELQPPMTNLKPMGPIAMTIVGGALTGGRESCNRL